MKKIYLVLLAALGLTVTSCLMEEKELFDKTPAERMDAYLEEYRNILSSTDQAWLLEYYAEEAQSYGGYVYVLKFTKSEVTAWFQLDDDVNTPVTSLYKMTPDDGPVLAFDTYNENLHFFATPDVSNYEALHGDYEFRVVGKNADETEVYLKGRRTGNSLKLVKLAADVDPVAYIEGCNAIQASMTAPAYAMTLNGEAASCSLKNNNFSYSYSNVVGEGEEATTEVVSSGSAFCYTPTGVQFYAPVVIDGVEYTGLVYNAADETLVSEDGKVVVSLVFPPLNQVLVSSGWFVVQTEMGGTVKTGFSNAETYVNGYLGMPFQYVILGPYIWGTYGLEHIIGGYYGSCGLSYELIDDNKVVYTYNQKNQSNGDTFYKYGFNYAVNAICGKTFVVTTDSQRSPSYLLLTDEANPDNFIKVLPSEVPYQ